MASRLINELHRMTSCYITHEDRLRLTGKTDGDAVVTLWLTQRLLNRLVGPLCQWLEQHHPAAVKMTSKLSARHHMEQTFVQQGATQTMIPHLPVVSERAGLEFLVESLDMQRRPKGIRLIFKNHQHEALATLTFGLTQARQWLAIVLSQYKVAHWPTTAWPAWMLETMQKRVICQESRLH